MVRQALNKSYMYSVLGGKLFDFLLLVGLVFLLESVSWNLRFIYVASLLVICKMRNT